MKWQKTLAAASPALAAALDGPFASAAKRLVAATVTGKSDATDAEIDAAMARVDVDGLDRLRLADAQWKDLMQRLGKNGLADQAAELSRWVITWTNPVLASGVVLGFFVTVYYVLTHLSGKENPIPQEFLALAGTLIGYVSAKADQVVSYYFGSSASSAAKTDILASVAKSAPAVAAPAAPTPTTADGTPTTATPSDVPGAKHADGTASVDDPDAGAAPATT